MRSFLCTVGICLASCVCLSQSVSAHFVDVAAALTGAAAGNASLGTGFAHVQLDLDEIKMTVEINFSNIGGNAVAANLHGPTANPLTGTAGIMNAPPTLLDFPTGVTSGTYTHVFDLTVAGSYNPAFIAANGGTVSGALNALIAAVEGEQSYINLTSSAFAGGELRAYLAVVPEPTTVTLFTVAVAGLAWRRRMARTKRPVGLQ